MPTVTATARERIQAQGFCGHGDGTYARIDYPLRIAPAICMTWAAVGAALRSPAVLWALVPFAALGALLTTHPFDVVYNHGLRHRLGGPRLPAYGARRRLACALAAVMLAAAAACFRAGLPIAGGVLGWSLVAAAFVNVSTGFCVPSFVVRVFFGKVPCLRR